MRGVRHRRLPIGPTSADGLIRGRVEARPDTIRPVNRPPRLALLVVLALLVQACGAHPSPSGAVPTPGSTGLAPAASGASGSATRSPGARSSTPATTAAAASPGGSAPSGLPDFAHVYVIVLENRGYPDIVGNSSAPYFNGLLHRYASLTDMFGETHPSQPNYFALFSGSTQGATTDGTYNLPARNLADQLESHGRTWAVFAQNVPYGCYTGGTSSGGADGSGTYARKHNPAISFTNISGNPGRCSHITDFAHFDPAAADFELIIPNLCNDMHDCSTSHGDQFLASFVPRITGSAAFANSVLFITFDEGTTNAYGGGRIATAVISPLVRPGSVDPELLHHYAIVRTIEDAWGLGCLANSCTSPNVGRLFGE